MRIGLPTAARGCVREKRRTRPAVDNPQPAEIAPIGPLKTVLTSGATSEVKSASRSVTRTSPVRVSPIFADMSINICAL